MAITTKSFYTNGIRQVAVVLYQNKSTYEYDDAVKIVQNTVGVNKYQDYTMGLLHSQFKYIPKASWPAWKLWE